MTEDEVKKVREKRERNQARIYMRMREINVEGY